MNIGNIFCIPPQKKINICFKVNGLPPPRFVIPHQFSSWIPSHPRCHIHGLIVQNKSFVPCNWSQHLGARLEKPAAGDGVLLAGCFFFEKNYPEGFRMKSLANVLKVYEDDILSTCNILYIYIYIFIYQTSFRTFSHLFQHGNVASFVKDMIPLWRDPYSHLFKCWRKNRGSFEICRIRSQ